MTQTAAIHTLPGLDHDRSDVLSLDLGTTTGWASLVGGIVHSGTATFRSGRYDGGGMR
jgi:hypothetical protein